MVKPPEPSTKTWHGRRCGFLLNGSYIGWRICHFHEWGSMFYKRGPHFFSENDSCILVISINIKRWSKIGWMNIGMPSFSPLICCSMLLHICDASDSPGVFLCLPSNIINIHAHHKGDVIFQKSFILFLEDPARCGNNSPSKNNPQGNQSFMGIRA